jgi:hypothetical protein
MLTTADLVAFDGSVARLWHFSATHNMLVVRLTSVEKEERFLVLSGCKEMRVRTGWRIGHMEVRAVDEPFVELVDGDILVRCQDVSIHATFEA